ncbi:M28 family peptidase [Myxococcota bacterium]|nr:M28 family peptidase [Myxococcota bacterium]MBU1383205.1 M28 family peptidase [Myxococcota bacterium]MBU1496439.1 M28 family peptidase [Myxococcota bacterium]
MKIIILNLKLFRIFILLTITLFSCCKRGTAGDSNKKASERSETSISQSTLRIKKSIEFLVTLNGRQAGTEDSKKAAAYLEKELKKLGAEPFDGAYIHEFTFHKTKKDQNVVGCFPGKSKEIIILGAHYDHLGKISKDVYPGADDNASGTAAVLEIMSLLKGKSTQVKVCAVFFGAEEKPIMGSSHFVEKHSGILKNLKLLINLDMVGREFFGSAFGKNSPDGVALILNRINDKLSTDLPGEFKKYGLQPMVVGDKFIQSFGAGFLYDSIPFNKKGFSTIFISTGLHKDYHKVTDTPEKIKFKKIASISAAVVSIVASLKPESL